MNIVIVLIILFIIYSYFFANKFNDSNVQSNTPIPDTIPYTIPYNVPDIEVFNDNSYDPYIINGKNVIAFGGKKVILIIDKNNIGTDLDYTDTNGNIIKPIINISSINKNLYYYAMAIFIDIIDKLILQYESMVGMIPQENSYKNRPIRIEISYINAGGLASHGISGMAAGPAFLRNFYDTCINYLIDNNQLPKIEHIFTYELMRNYIFPNVFTPIMDYRLYEIDKSTGTNIRTKKLNVDEWGWVNQGFVNVTGGLLSVNIEPKILFNYFGYDAEGFWATMEKHLDTYIESGKPWEEIYMYNRLEWTEDRESLDNLYSGLLIRLWRNYGRFTFLQRMFKAIRNMYNRSGNNYRNKPWASDYIDNLSYDYNSVIKLNYQTARENFYIASSYGANTDLYDYFVNTLRCPIRNEARTYAINLINRG